MKTTTLVARVSRVQTLVTTLALVLVSAGTLAVLDAVLSWKADHLLLSILDRAERYVRSAKLESLDWRWLTDEVEELRPPDVRIEVEDERGRLRIVAGTGMAPRGAPDACVQRGAVRGCTRAYHGIVLRAARDRSDDREVELYLALVLLATTVVVGTGVALGSRAVTRRATEPVSELAARVQALEPARGDGLRFESGLTELDALAKRFDDLIQRFHAALAREQRFSAEASHELRTPLTVARAELEGLVATGADSGAIARAISSVDKLSELVDALLWFARAQGRLDAEQLEVVNVADLVRSQVRTVERAHPVEATHEFPDEALVRGDEELLKRAIANLFENAVKHGDATPVRVSLTHQGARLELAVQNGGPAIPVGSGEQIFEPLYRLRRPSDDSPGFGLGLPFARAVARSHGGDLLHVPRLVDSVEMRLSLPVVEWSEGSSA